MIMYKGHQYTIYRQAHKRVVLQREGVLLVTTWDNIDKPQKQRPWKQYR
mgnify:CR=1 FL=1